MHHHPFGFTFDQERAAGLLGSARELGIVSVIATLLSGIAVAIFALTLLIGPADAKVSDPRHPSFEQNSFSARSHRARRVHRRAHHVHHAARHHRRDRAPFLDANGNRPGLITVSTAAGINITCSSGFASEAAALIADAVAQGIKFHRITCYSRARTHVANSNHRSGNAFDSLPSIPAHLVRAHGLRSGFDFRDCQHVDNARNVGGIAYWNRVKHHGPTFTASAERRHHRHRVAMIGR
jgi:hypothetical protein